MSSISETITVIALAIVGVALAAVLVSRNAQTPQVIQAAGTAFGSGLAVAEAPITGATATPNLTYPSSGIFGGSFQSGLQGFGGGNGLFG